MTEGPGVGEAAGRWADLLAGWAILPELLASAPVNPWGFPVGLFAAAADDAIGQVTPTTLRAREALPAGGAVLDVGCGAGAASLPLVPPAGVLVGLDESAGMLEAFAERAERLGVEHRQVQGRWPEAAATAPEADVAVSRNVVYNVADIDPFVRELDAHARNRVVVELTSRHPLAWLAPYWRDIHGLERPQGPTGRDFLAVLEDAGFVYGFEYWQAPWTLSEADERELVAFLRMRLCLGPDRDDEVRQALARHGVPAARSALTVYW